MGRGNSRNMRVADIMTMVSAVALGLAWSRLNVALKSHFETNPRALFAALSPGKSWWEYLSCFLPLFTLCPLSILTSWLVSRRSSLTREIRHPGLIACFGAALVFVLECARALIVTGRQIVMNGFSLEAHDHYYNFVWWQSVLPVIVPSEFALAILCGWLLQGLYRKCRPEPSWLDRAGRAVGVFWLVWSAIDELQPWSWLGR
jgi:hypothetical protein